MSNKEKKEYLKEFKRLNHLKPEERKRIDDFCKEKGLDPEEISTNDKLKIGAVLKQIDKTVKSLDNFAKGVEAVLKEDDDLKKHFLRGILATVDLDITLLDKEREHLISTAVESKIKYDHQKERIDDFINTRLGGFDNPKIQYHVGYESKEQIEAKHKEIFGTRDLDERLIETQKAREEQNRSTTINEMLSEITKLAKEKSKDVKITNENTKANNLSHAEEGQTI